MDTPSSGSFPLESWERTVLRHLLLSEPDAAVATQLAGATVRRRECLGPALLIRLRAAEGSFPGPRGALFGGHTFARIPGCPARAAFTLHFDDAGWVSHLFAFLEDDSSWPQEPGALEVMGSAG
jgi:hypothetical protein